MKTSIALLLAFIVSIVTASAAFPIVPSTADAQWQSMVTPTHNGNVYWDNTSGDFDMAGGGANVGFYLTGNFGFTGTALNVGANTIYTPGALSPALGQSASNWQYLSTVSTPYQGHTIPGSAAFYLTSGIYTFTDLGSITADTNGVMGWFSLSDPNTLHPIFTGRSPSPDQVIVSANGPIGLYFTSPSIGATELSTDSLPAPDGDNDNDDNLNQLKVIGNGMAVFQQTGGPATNFGSLLVGFEDYWDTNFNGEGTTDDGFRSDSDYNDLMVGIKYTAFTDIPEPSTTALLAGSVMALLAWQRRRRTS